MTTKNILKLIVYIIVLGIFFVFCLFILMAALDPEAGMIKLIAILLLEPFIIIAILSYVEVVKELFK